MNKFVSDSIRILLIFSVLLTVGCASMRDVEVPPQVEGVEPNVYIMRNYNYFGSANYFWPTVDGKDAAGLLGNTHIELALSVGHHKLGNRCFGGWAPVWTHDEIDVEVTNDPQYFLISPAPNICGEIEKISTDAAKKILSQSVKVEPGHVVRCEGKDPDSYCLNAAFKRQSP